jgi:hypothetical protein
MAFIIIIIIIIIIFSWYPMVSFQNPLGIMGKKKIVNGPLSFMKMEVGGLSIFVKPTSHNMLCKKSISKYTMKIWLGFWLGF